MVGDALYRQVRAQCPAEADGVLMVGTGLRCVGLLEALEQDLRRPVVSANQASLWALLADTSPFGSQNDDAGTRQRRCSKLSRQNAVRSLSSRALVTRRSARPGWQCDTPIHDHDLTLAISGTADDRSIVVREDRVERLERLSLTRNAPPI